ncbi:hypothetical protein, partial [Flavonifractor plautii]|uniref:hypothetical protein n=1 Tax=Flavonifractor plautii TaxID=292800 RepID=UPI003D7D5DBC
VEAAGRELKRLHAENERLRGDYALRGAQIQRMAALIDELEARKPLPLSDERVDDLHGEANRGFDIGREEYFKAFRDAESAHGIKEP